MDLTAIVILINTLTSIGLFIGTLYRIKIEHKSIKIAERNAEAYNRLRAISEVIYKEKDEILKMSREEFLEMLNEVFKIED